MTVALGPTDRRGARPAIWLALAVFVIAALLLMATGASEISLGSLTRAWRSLIGLALGP